MADIPDEIRNGNDLASAGNALKDIVQSADTDSPLDPKLTKIIATSTLAATVSGRYATKKESLAGVAIAANKALAEAATAASIHNFAHGKIKDGTSNAAAAIAAIAAAISTGLSTAGPAGKALAKIAEIISIAANGVSIGLANINTQAIADAYIDHAILQGRANLADPSLTDAEREMISRGLEKFEDEVREERALRKQKEEQENKNNSQTNESDDYLKKILDNLNKISVDEMIKAQNEIKKQINKALNEIPPFLKNPSMWLNFATGNWTGLLREMFFHQIDPLALDLNGNGIETLAANGHDGALFDHERLGIRTATGWIHSNDGILVYDRNGDGKINDGGEIFGDNTLLKNGKTAAHGFEAAADLDDNGDGKLDAADSAFGKLGVWRDLNHNGISEEGEIFALKDLRIKSLNLGYTQADKDLGNGNTLAEVGSYTDEDGNEHIMGDLRLSADRLHSRYSNSIPLTDEQQQEVNLRGSGRLRDLREAAAQSSELAEVLQQYKNAASKEEQLALRHKLLKAWADTDPQRFEDFKSTMKTMIQSEERKGIGLTPSQVEHMNEIMVMGFWKVLGQPDPAGQKQAELNRRIAILDAFTGTRSPNLYYFSKKEAQHIVDTVNDTYERLADSLYDGLLFQTRLRPYLDAMRLGISEEGKYSIDTATSPHASPKFTRKIPAKPSPTLANC